MGKGKAKTEAGAKTETGAGTVSTTKTGREIPIFCSHTTLIAPGELVPHPQNPNRHPKEQIQSLSNIILGNGWRTSITRSKRSGFVVRGHARLEVALLLGCSVVPVDEQDYSSEAAELADLVADNRIAELSETDTTVLGKVLSQLDRSEVDLKLTGYSRDDLERFQPRAIQPEEIAPPDDLADLTTEPDPLEPTPLPEPEVTGSDNRAGRFLLVYTSEDERVRWCRVLGVPDDCERVVLSIEDLASLQAERAAKE